MKKVFIDGKDNEDWLKKNKREQMEDLKAHEIAKKLQKEREKNAGK